MLSALLKKSEPRKNAPAPELSNEPVEGNALFEAMVCEFHWAALQIGAITCTMNAAVGTGRTWMLRSCTNLIPVELQVIRLALRSWRDIGFPKDTAIRINRIYFDMADAKKQAVPLIDSASKFGGPQIPKARLEQITALWRKLSDDCYEAAQELEPETRWRLNGIYTGNTLILGRFLKDAISGGSACVNVIGEVTLPVLPQRRRLPRYALLQPCKVTSQGQTFGAFARDISRSGIGINCEHDMKLRDTVSIELRNGRKFKGVIAWRKDGKFGIQFENPLVASDPLIPAQG